MRKIPAAPVRILVPVVAAVLAAAAAHGQTKVGTTMAQFLLIEPSARITAMGNAGVSLPGGLDAAYYNAAAAVAEERIGVQISHGEWFADISHDYVAAAFPMGHWGVATASLTALGSGDMEVRTVNAPLGTGERFQVSDLAIGLGYAKRITDRFSAGARLCYVQESIWNSSFRTATLDFGTLYALSERGLHIGASLSHFGTQGSYDGRDLQILYDNDPDRYGDNSALPGQRYTDSFPVPVLFRVGVGMPIQLSPTGRLLVAVDAYHPSDNEESVSFGTELVYRDFVALRTGYQNLLLKDSEVGFTAGGGLLGDVADHTYRLDYAWADHGRLGGTHRVTLGWAF